MERDSDKCGTKIVFSIQCVNYLCRLLSHESRRFKSCKRFTFKSLIVIVYVPVVEQLWVSVTSLLALLLHWLDEFFLQKIN